MSWECLSCSREFVVEHSTACPGCGGIDTVELPENVVPSANGEATGVDKTPHGVLKDSSETTSSEECLATVREILRSLCSATYESTYQSAEWERLIDRTIPQLYAAIKEGERQ